MKHGGESDILRVMFDWDITIFVLADRVYAILTMTLDPMWQSTN